MERVYHLIVHHPKSVLLLILLLTSFFVSHARHIRLNSSVENLFSQDDPEKQYYTEIHRLFGNDEIAVIGLVTENIYIPAVLEKLKRITAQVEKVDGVQSVASLTNVPDPIANVVEPPLLIPQIPATPEALAALRKKVEENPIYLNLASRDGTGAALIIFFKNLSTEEFAQKQIDEKLQAIIDRERGNDKIYLTGMQNIKLNSVKLMQQDLRMFIPLSLAVIIVVLAICFRNLRGVILPLLSVGCGVIWTLGTMVLTEESITIGTLVLPSLLIVIGSTYSIYVIAQYEEEAEKGGSPQEVVYRSLVRVSVPVTVAALTTIVGFVTLLVNRIGSIRALGLYGVVGFASVTIIMLTLIPAALALLSLPRRSRTPSTQGGLNTLLARIAQFDRDHQKLIMVAVALLLIPCFWGIARIRVDSNFLQFFRADSPVRRANEIVSEKIGGAQIFYVVVESGTREGVKSWEVLRRIKGLQRYLASLPGVDQTLSLADYCDLFDKAIQSGGMGSDEVVVEGAEPVAEPPPTQPSPPATPVVLLADLWEKAEQIDPPDQLRAVMQLLSVIPKTLSSVVSPDFSTGNILVRTRLTSSSDIIRTAEAVEAYAKEHFPPEVTVRPTGSLILLNKATENIVIGQIQSFALATGAIFVIMSALFLSARVGVIAMIPNLFPILVLFGLMGVSGIVLNLGTSTIATLALGIAVANTVHLMTRLSFEMRADADQERALLQTLSTVGKPSVYVSSSLFLGFLTLYFSTFIPIQKFGLLFATVIVVTLVGNVMLLPALLASRRILTVWDLLYTVTQLTQKLEQRVAERTQELQEVNRQLEAASRHKSEFLARMSHELRTPMNAIIGFTRLVMRRAKDTLPKREHENLGKVLISAEHLLALINDILDLSKVEAGRMEVHAVRFELEPLIDLCLHTVEPLVKGERLRLVKELRDDIPELFTDQDKLKQILMNLLSNAIKFAEAGTITVTAQCQDGKVAIAVADTGIGIPAEQLALVFEEFHQVDSSHTRQYSGTGLGLSISRHFAQLLGGDITLQSTVGVGSIFTVAVPVHYDTTRLIMNQN